MKYFALSIPGNNGSIDIKAPSGSGIISTDGPGALSNIISAGLNLAMVVAVIACFLMLILGGFNWMTSQGDKQKLASARQRIAMAIIGLIVVFISFVIINIIYNFFNLGGNNFLGSQQ